MMADPENVPIVPIFVPTLFQNGCGFHNSGPQIPQRDAIAASSRAQLSFPARRLKRQPFSTLPVKSDNQAHELKELLQMQSETFPLRYRLTSHRNHASSGPGYCRMSPD